MDYSESRLRISNVPVSPETIESADAGPCFDLACVNLPLLGSRDDQDGDNSPSSIVRSVVRQKREQVAPMRDEGSRIARQPVSRPNPARPLA